MTDSSTTGAGIENRNKPQAGGFRAERLALLYEGLLTAIVRVQSGRQQIQGSDVFRERMKRALEEITDSASRKGYAKDDVQQANFAVIAFLDEAVLNSQDPGRTQWARKSLQEELFDQRSAGELFFKRLEELRAHGDSSQLAEVLEVYCLCLLLGYEGRYVGSKAELHLLMDHLRERIERISGRNPEFSPDAKPPDQAPAAPPADPLPRRLRFAAAGALALALLFYLGFYGSLSGRVGEVQRVAQRVTN